MPTMNLEIATGGDDGFGFAGGNTFDNDSTTAFFGDDGDSSHAFFRFELPDGTLAGSTITSAVLTLFLDGGPGNCEVDIFGVDEDNPDAPTSWNQLSGLTYTPESEFWNPLSDNGDQDAPDLTDIIQELVDNFPLGSGDAIMVVLDGDAYGTTAAREAHCWESTQPPARLVINYEAGGPTTITSVYDGADFVPVTTKVWDGSNWVDVVTKVWDGNAWVP